MTKKAKWIWYPGDYETALFNKCMAERYERDVLITPFWRMDTHYVSVKFYADFTLTKPNHIKVKVEGDFNIFIEELGYIRDFDGVLELPAGDYHMQILVNNTAQLPCIYVDGEEIKSSSETFRVTCQDHVYLPAAEGEFDCPNITPNQRNRLEKEVTPISTKQEAGGILYDFGKEISARLIFSGCKDGARIVCYYGESLEEALDEQHCEQLDRMIARGETVETPVTKAFRYLLVLSEAPYEKLTVLAEASKTQNRGSFKTSDSLLQQIYDVSIYTLELCKKEFFLDGAKRDRWAWSGDAYQSYLVNYYSFCDDETVKRTILALKGKEPIKTHINHIMDYTMYWILSLYDYIKYGGDKQFVAKIYDGAKGYIDFLLGRRNKEGFLHYLFGDWIFIDWAPMDNAGETSFEQILFVETLKRFADVTRILEKGDGKQYDEIAKELLEKTIEVFWQDGCFVHGRLDGKLQNKVTRYANMFAVMYGLLDEEKTTSVIEKVLLNDEVQQITTPYMRFYEQATLSKIAVGRNVVAEMKEYWGGMLAHGATTFWEAFDPNETGLEKYAMYDRPYGKSLCHAWGANPIYLIFNCILGIEPLTVGYDQFICKPKLWMMPDFECSCPIGKGMLHFTYDKTIFTIRAENGEGYLVLPKEFIPCGEVETEQGKYKVRVGETLRFTCVDKGN